MSKYFVLTSHSCLDHVGSVLAHVDDTSGYFHGSLRLPLPRQRIQSDVRSSPSDPRADNSMPS